MEAGRVNVRFTGDSSNFEAAANRATQAAQKTGAQVINLQDRMKGMRSGFSATAAAANNLAGSFGSAGSKVTSFAATAVGAFAAGGPFAVGVAVAVGAVTTLVGVLDDAKTSAAEAAKAGATAFAEQGKAVREFAAETQRAIRLRNILIGGGSEADLQGLESKEKGQGLLGGRGRPARRSEGARRASRSPGSQLLRSVPRHR
jgi:hypothetical protein